MHITSSFFRLILLGSAFLILISCQADRPKAETSQSEGHVSTKEFTVYPMETPNWFRNTILFYVDFTNSELATFAQVEKAIPTLKRAGITAVVLGQIYASDENGLVVDYTKVDPDLGSFEEFKSLNSSLRQERMQILLAWDMTRPSPQHVWQETNPQWFDANGEFDLDHSNLSSTLIECMKFWLRASEVAGFWSLNAGSVPEDYWQQCRPSLEELKSVVMLSDETEAVDHHRFCFEVSSGQQTAQLLTDVLSQEAKLKDLIEHHRQELANYPSNYNRYHLIEGAPNSAIDQLRLGLQVIWEGVPIYTSLEQLSEAARFTRVINLLKQHNKSLWNTKYEGRMKIISIGADVVLINRSREGQQVNILANLSDQRTTFVMPETLRTVSDPLAQRDRSFVKDKEYSLEAHQLIVMANPSIQI